MQNLDKVDFEKQVVWPFERSPRKVQIDALQAALFSEGFGYFMRMRMGKTGTVLAEFALYDKINDVQHMLVVCPNSLKEQWADAVKEWGFQIPVHIYQAHKKHDAKRFLERNQRSIMILNYDSLASYVNLRLHTIISPARSMIVFDESTAIKEFKATRTKTALSISPKYKYRRILTGKPRANSNLDYYTQLKVIGAHKGMSYLGFRNTFCKLGGYQGKQVIGDQNNELLKNLMEGKTFIAGDEYLVDLPPKIYMPLRQVNMTPAQAVIYKQMEDHFIAEIADDTTTAAIVLTKYLRLRQITSGFVTTQDGTVQEIMPPLENPRIREVLDMMQSEITSKVIIVTTFKYSADALMNALERYRPVKLVGGMSLEQIKDAKDTFNTKNNCRVLIGQEQVLQYGHTLPGPDGDPCDTIIFYENSFSLINRAQCEARPEVVGRHKPISVIDFYSSEMDKYLINSLRRKEDAALALLGYSRSKGVFGEGAN